MITGASRGIGKDVWPKKLLSVFRDLMYLGSRCRIRACIRLRHHHRRQDSRLPSVHRRSDQIHLTQHYRPAYRPRALLPILHLNSYLHNRHPLPEDQSIDQQRQYRHIPPPPHHFLTRTMVERIRNQRPRQISHHPRFPAPTLQL